MLSHSVRKAVSREAHALRCPQFPKANVESVILSNGLKCFVVTGADVKRYFGASVFTPAVSSKGEQHITEHLVLRGSRNFPNPNVYSELHANSENSPGACTYHGKTWYYGSSLTDAGLQHTSAFLLDAMFNPLLTREAFEAESFRPIHDLDPRGRKLVYPAGVVFNEMRQSYRHHNSVAIRNAVAHLMPEFLPQLDYAGSPYEMPPLTHNEIVRYHERFYFPENAVYFVAHPKNPEAILLQLENLPVSSRSHGYEFPRMKPSGHTPHMHFEYETSVHVTPHSSNLVIFIPMRKPASLREMVYCDLIYGSMYYFDRNRYSREFYGLKTQGRACIGYCYRQQLGQQNFFTIQVDGLGDKDLYPVTEAILSSYKNIGPKTLPISSFMAALASARHEYTSGLNNPAEFAFNHLTAEWDNHPDLNMMLLAETARKLLQDPDKSYAEFCHYAGEILKHDALIFSQTPVPKGRANSAKSGRKQPGAIHHDPERQVVHVPPYDLKIRTILKEAPKPYPVSMPFRESGIEKIVRTPVGDQQRIHLNVGFDLSYLPQYLWTHALSLLHTFSENQASFSNSTHSNLRFHRLSATPLSKVYPVTETGCHFFLNFSVFPDELEKFLGFLKKVFNSPDFERNSYINGLYYQRDEFYSDIYDPWADQALGESFMTRALAYHDRGFRLREAITGLGTIQPLNKLITSYEHDHFDHSGRRLHTAVNYLFSSSSLLLQYSAPDDCDDRCASALKSFLKSLREWPRDTNYIATRIIPRNDLLVAPTATNITARVIPIENFDPAFEVPLNYIRGFVFSDELCARRGFYRDFSQLDPSSRLLILMSQRGSSAIAPFGVYDSLPERLAKLHLSQGQLKALRLGAFKNHMARLNESDPHSCMLKALRYHNRGYSEKSLEDYAEGILSATLGTFRTFGELLHEKRRVARNVVMTNKKGAEAVKSALPGIRFGKPTLCNL